MKSDAQICVLVAVHTEITARETEAKCMHCNTQYTQQASKATKLQLFHYNQQRVEILKGVTASGIIIEAF